MTAKENLENLQAFAAAAKEELAALGISKRLPNRYPFDYVAEEILSKAFALVRSVGILIESDQPEEAFGLARSIVECALNLRWITSDKALIQARAFMFARYGVAVKNFSYWWVKKRYSARPRAHDADDYAVAWNLVADASGAFRHWSGVHQFPRIASELKHPLDADKLVAEDHAAKRAHDYFHPSCFVHCSQPGVDSYYSEQGNFEIHRHSVDPRDFGQLAILICNIYLHDLIAYGMYGMHVYRASPLNSLLKHNFRGDIEQFRFKD